MNREELVTFLAGAVTLGYALAGCFFFRFWRRTRDGLFLAFAIAFELFALNQLLVTLAGTQDERAGYLYVFRALGFVIILVGIVRKNVAPR